ncbi:dynamin GTPase [Trichophyton equinum CBS 127.97]|uniref:Dynamin GTPase n=1 Tax=Trichophyton equinum (strain ATCC MYA-4606 / CBS 127.97) TaxID=559882 RepID=F2PQM4_TRIEC|nr:dynamin GTPase [Trichophyton equinum CBS 127.97]
MISVSIRPHVNAGKEHAEKMRGWKAELETLNAESFSKIMAEVHEVMELSGRSKLSDRRTFSNDVLRLEISGPNEDHLSVIDVPGIFKNTTEGVTTKANIDLVRDMVHGYMRNPRSVILTVVPSNVDIATQEIVEMARELDPNGDRTLGVLTKPDLVDKGAENVIIDIISGKRSGNKVQWSVVRNPGQQDLLDQNTGRQSEVEFFRDRSPWNTLDKDRVGVDALRIRLQEVITTRTRHEFPKVKAKISKRLQVSRQIFNSLGTKRDTIEKQRAFLISLVEQFQKIVSYAIAANYGADNIFNKPELRIATEVARRSDVFSEQIEKWGHKRQFEYQANVTAPPVEYASSPTPTLFTPRPTPHSLRDYFEDAISQDNEDKGEDNKGGEPKIEVRTTADKEDLEDVLHPQKSLLLPGAEIMSWLENEYRASRGFELGTFRLTLLPAILKE